MQSVGTAHSLHGAVSALRRRNPAIHTVAVEPEESPVLSEGRTGGHRIEGIGIGFVPPLWDPSDASEIATVTSDEAHDMARRLAREEGLFAGASSGANVVAALRVATRLRAGATCRDSGSGTSPRGPGHSELRVLSLTARPEVDRDSVRTER